MKKTLTILALTAAIGLSTNAALARPLETDGLTGPNTQNQVGLLLPAVQAARESSRRSTRSSSTSRHPDFAWLPVNNSSAAPGGLPRGYGASRGPETVSDQPVIVGSLPNGQDNPPRR